MRESTRIARLAAALLALASPCAAEVPPGLLHDSLDNGLEVTILPDGSMPVVSTQIWYRVGSANEDDRSRGLAHFFEHMMFGDTANHGKSEYALWHVRHGGYENAYTSPDETVYVSEIPPEGHRRVLDFEADRMANILFTGENLENEKNIVVEELRLRGENDPLARVMLAVQKRLLGTHPYAYDKDGSKEDVAAATVEQCRSFYERWYRPDNAHLVVVGPVGAVETMAAVRERFGGLEPGAVEAGEIPALDAWSFPAESEFEEDLPPVEVALWAFPLPPAGAGDAEAIEVLLEILAGGALDPVRDDLVRRRGKALEAGIESISLRRGGAVILYSASLPYRRKATAWRLLGETRDRLSRLEWLTDERLAAAKRSILRRALWRRYYASSLADAIGRARWWTGDVARAFDRPDRIRAVTRDDVERAWLRFVAGPDPVRVYIEPERVPLLVRLFGWLQPLVAR